MRRLEKLIARTSKRKAKPNKVVCRQPLGEECDCNACEGYRSRKRNDVHNSSKRRNYH